MEEEVPRLSSSSSSSSSFSCCVCNHDVSRVWKPNSLGNLLQWQWEFLRYPQEQLHNQTTSSYSSSSDHSCSKCMIHHQQQQNSCENLLSSSHECRRSSRSTGMATKIVPLDFCAKRQGSNKVSRLEKNLSVAENAIEGLRFISSSIYDQDLDQVWRHVDARFATLCSPDGLLARSDFGECIGMNDSKEFSLQLFDALRRNQFRKSGSCFNSISKQELHQFWSRITDRSFKARIRIFFDLCDKDSDGRITEAEVKEVLLLSASANKLSMLHEQAEEYAALIMEELDRENHGYIGLSELETLFQEAFANEASLQSYSSQSPTRKKRKSCWWWEQEAISRAEILVRSNWKRAWIVALWLLICVLLFTWKFLQYRRRAAFQIMGYCVCTAKGAAETLKFNMALVLLPVCRNTITWLRGTALSSVFSFSDNINFHKLIAAAIVIGVILHGGTHLACDFPRIVNANFYTYEATVGPDFDERRLSYADIVMTTETMSGILMVILMAVAFLLATRLSRRNIVTLPWPFHRFTGFNAFWYSHHLFVVVYVLLILHSLFLFFEHDWFKKTTWMYLAVPLLLYCGERTLRALRARKYRVKILEATTYPGDVLSLKISRPAGFNYKSGMYIYIQCPEISALEWHPFSLTSAPGDEYLSVHIRALGDWTDDIRRLFAQRLQQNLNMASAGDACAVGSILSLPNNNTTNSSISKIGESFCKLYIDGPYGAAAQDYSKYEVMLLIGLGIGATPFISILRDIVNPRKSSSSFTRNSNSNSTRMNVDEECGGIGKIAYNCKTYFYWVTREQSSFEWFKSIIMEVQHLDRYGMIEMHNYLTSVYEEGDARSALITMVQALHHAKRGLDIVSGTPVPTHFARPNWRKVLSRISSRHEGSTIGVFYCGTNALAKEMDMLCKKFTRTSKAKFVFHKENY